MTTQHAHPFDDLDDLFYAMTHDDPRVFDETGVCWRTDLPTFGGDEPIETDQVWSWDEERIIIGTCTDELEIEMRQTHEARVKARYARLRNS